jgi:hypothetical protein
MPRFFFDLYFDHYVVLDPAGISFERKARARAAARQMARHLATVRADLLDRRSWIRVRDIGRNEIHRLAIQGDSRADECAVQAVLRPIAAE